MFYIDPSYLIVMLVSLALSLFASSKVKSAFKKYKQVPAHGGLTGAEVAKRIMDYAGIRCDLEPTGKKSFFGGDGEGLDDHYDPKTKTVRLSPQVYGARSVAAYGIAAHEVGHAIQHAQGYKLLEFRNTIAPAAQLGSNFSYWLILIGFVLNSLSFIKIGIIFFAVVVVFQLITVPVEFDASKRAKKLLSELGLVHQAEADGVAAVLNAAALTYVAAAATAVLNLIYLILRSRR
ncbi:MAG: hypothetical protein COX62_04385 [Deltaproteobacteria bacterium CG_4_10_14_0_2_um_filter_43_8]|nr:MAG: hypothetical protein COV43_05225 [Deltaproteobacteria bacterium CG11_big_fil_rev_8_21_14_0_20_42_23]PJA20577.1 MAG: hypothetical protein COX62_04385 [Deltaproteobacteria bacterium CG_4_10_14_0_2_um_filter_43_8]PJC63632.1 MAG: hypothetical protein CO021_08705 [Deltaproteobacteria bacterium CG_4_9_14_0_2_um_filter_42_21]